MSVKTSQLLRFIMIASKRGIKKIKDSETVFCVYNWNESLKACRELVNEILLLVSVRLCIRHKCKNECKEEKRMTSLIVARQCGYILPWYTKS